MFLSLSLSLTLCLSLCLLRWQLYGCSSVPLFNCSLDVWLSSCVLLLLTAYSLACVSNSDSEFCVHSQLLDKEMKNLKGKSKVFLNMLQIWFHVAVCRVRRTHTSKWSLGLKAPAQKKEAGSAQQLGSWSRWTNLTADVSRWFVESGLALWMCCHSVGWSFTELKSIDNSLYIKHFYWQ